ncbi:ADP-ribosylglycohydrolase family protein [Nocardiopsis mangrovi]|uniref:ADP-ribosylglycohydrolase family protein n=1 Tax=Nocardiopsis mangrovi TaxID=1179818 RepID=A0ABV9E2G5_9ACTN
MELFLPPLDPDRLLGCLLGLAIGDALGAPVDELSLAGIRERHGPEGVRDFDGNGVAAITANTQMALCTARAALRASARGRAKGIGGAALGLVQTEYLTWLSGQGETAAGPSGPPGPVPPMDDPLTARRAPGGTSLSALRRAAERERPGLPLGTVDEPINASKGCGAVARAAPCGFGAGSMAAAFDFGSGSAALTHGDPGGYLPAGMLAATVWALIRGARMDDAVARALGILLNRRGHGDVSSAVRAATELTRGGPPEPEGLDGLGTERTGDRALAAAVCVARCAPAFDGERSMAGIHDLRRGPDKVGRRALAAAVNHSGASATVGAICGALVGACYGTAAFPGHWQALVEVRPHIIGLAADCALEFGPNPPTDPRHGGPSFGWPSGLPEG